MYKIRNVLPDPIRVAIMWLQRGTTYIYSVNVAMQTKTHAIENNAWKTFTRGDHEASRRHKQDKYRIVPT